jgi:hypothetical protein
MTTDERGVYHDAVGGFSAESKLMFVRGGDLRRIIAAESP